MEKRKRPVRTGSRRRNSHSDELRRYLLGPKDIPAICFEIPEELENCVRSYLKPSQQASMLKDQFPCIFEDLNPQNYQNRMDTFLFLEQINHKNDYERLSAELQCVYIYYDETDDLYHLDDILHLELDKQRPRIPIGGRIKLMDEDGEYLGVIMSVQLEGIAFDLPHDDINDGIYCVSLIYSETNMKKQLLSLRRVVRYFGFSFLFPDLKVTVALQFPGQHLSQWFNPLLNNPQKKAVKQILCGSCRPMPYVVLGPPGTGKTITLVEAVCQVATLVDHSVILVATSSNRCANNIAQKLSTVDLDERFVRLTSLNYFEKGLVPEDIKKFAISAQYATPEVIKKYKIVVGTCSSLGKFMFKELPSNYFTHVFVDEAGQVTEPEVMMPISLLDSTRCQIVLFGDPLQVGPSVFGVHCKSQNEDRLDCSFLSRIMEFEPYRNDEDSYDNDLVTKLIYNYR